jgi:prepilin-type N-terminal cleavage/methylation domain-containing protein
MKAFTLVEVLVTVTLIGILTIAFFDSNLFSFQDTKSQFMEAEFLDLKYLHQSKQLSKSENEEKLYLKASNNLVFTGSSENTDPNLLECNNSNSLSLTNTDILFFCEESYESFLYDADQQKFIKKDLLFEQEIGNFNKCKLNGEDTFGFINFEDGFKLFINAQTCTLDLSKV